MSTPLDDDTIANGDVIETIQLTQLFPIVEALEDNQTNYREDIGVADAYKVDFSGTGQPNEISAYQAGQQIVFKAANANTGAATLQVAGPSGDLSALALKKFGNVALEAGDIQADQIVMAVYNNEGSGRFEVVGAPPTIIPPEPQAPDDGTGFYRDDEGSADSYELDASGSGDNPTEINALVKGQIFTFKAFQSNTGSSTLEVIGPSGSLGTKDITKRGEALDANDIVAESMVAVLYNDEDGGRFEMLGSASAGGGGSGAWLFGDGYDGDDAFSYDVDLTEHKFYNNLTIDYGVRVRTNGFKLHVCGILENYGTIHSNGLDGENASGATPGNAGHGGNFNQVAWQGHWGGSGSLQTGATVSNESNRVFYARGGAGGEGSYGSGGGAENNYFIDARFFQTLTAYLSGVSDFYSNGSPLLVAGGMGGGGGTGNDDDAAGGGGGGSGGVVWVAARTLTGNGTLECRGGNGGAAGGTDAGGGGGGGGGLIYLLTNDSASPYSTDVYGGVGGAGGGGAGTNGANGDGGLYVFRGRL